MKKIFALGLAITAMFAFINVAKAEPSHCQLDQTCQMPQYSHDIIFPVSKTKDGSHYMCTVRAEHDDKKLNVMFSITSSGTLRFDTLYDIGVQEKSIDTKAETVFSSSCDNGLIIASNDSFNTGWITCSAVK